MKNEKRDLLILFIIIVVFSLFVVKASSQSCPSQPLNYPCYASGGPNYTNYDEANIWIQQDSINAILRRLIKQSPLMVTACPSLPLNYPCDGSGNPTYTSYDLANIWIQQDTTIVLLKKLSGALGNSYWSLTGNAGTTPGTNFLGTNDNQPLVFRVDGVQSGYIDNFTTFNTAYGFSANPYNIGTGNTAFGTSVLNETTGNNNTGTGYECMATQQNGSANSAYGAFTLYNCLHGSQNVGIGDSSLYSNISGVNNTALGFNSGYLYTGSNALFLGNRKTKDRFHSKGLKGLLIRDSVTGLISDTTLTIPSGGWSLTGNAGITPFTNFLGTTDNKTISFSEGANCGYITFRAACYGYKAGDSSVAGTQSRTAFGTEALQNVTTGGDNDAFGFRPLQNLTTGAQNVAIGDFDLQYLTTGSNNIALGYNAMVATTQTVVSNDIAIGVNALGNMIGNQNIAVGGACLANNSGAGYNNVCMGYQTANLSGKSTSNTYIGAYVAQRNSGGSQNVFIGDSASTPWNTGNDNIAIGYMANIGTALNSITNSIAIGANSTAHGSNNITFGNASSDSITTYAIVNIQTPITTYTASVSGSCTFTEPFGGSSFKEVIIHSIAASGTVATYTFPIPFTNSDFYIDGFNVSIVSVTTTGATVTGVGTSGYIFIKGQ